LAFDCKEKGGERRGGKTNKRGNWKRKRNQGDSVQWAEAGVGGNGKKTNKKRPSKPAQPEKGKPLSLQL